MGMNEHAEPEAALELAADDRARIADQVHRAVLNMLGGDRDASLRETLHAHLVAPSVGQVRKSDFLRTARK